MWPFLNSLSYIKGVSLVISGTLTSRC